MSPLTAQVKSKGGEGNEERMENAPGVSDVQRSLIVASSVFNSSIDIHVHTQTILCELRVAPRALMLSKAALFH